MTTPPPAPSSAMGPRTQTTRRSEVLDVAEATRAILTFSDVTAIDALAEVFAATPSLRGYLIDEPLWHELLALHFGGGLPEDLASLALPRKSRPWDWSDPTRTCPALRAFLRSGDERAHFARTLTVVRGDIGKITEIDGQPLDGLAFPTNSHLTNHYVGAANAVFKRAGKGLCDLVHDPNFRRQRNVGDAVATPAFDAGVSRLIHCVGPRASQRDCYERLAMTYETLMNTVLAEDLHCVAIASISTGAMGVRVGPGSQFALRAIQKFIRANHWEGRVAIVCYEDHVLEAFTKQREVVLSQFNVTPAFPEVTRDHWL